MLSKRGPTVSVVFIAAGLLVSVALSAETSATNSSELRTIEWFISEYKKALPDLERTYSQLKVEYVATSYRDNQSYQVVKGMYGRDQRKQLSQARITDSAKGAGRQWAAIFTPTASFSVSAEQSGNNYVLTEWVASPPADQLSVSRYLQHFPCGWEMLANIPAMLDDPTTTLADVKIDTRDPRLRVSVKFAKRFDSGVVRDGCWRFLSANGWLLESTVVNFNDPQLGSNLSIGLDYKFDESDPPKLLEAREYRVNNLSGKTVASELLTVSSFEFRPPEEAMFSLAYYGVKRSPNSFFTPALVILAISLVVLVFFSAWRRWASE